MKKRISINHETLALLSVKGINLEIKAYGPVIDEKLYSEVFYANSGLVYGGILDAKGVEKYFSIRKHSFCLHMERGA